MTNFQAQRRFFSVAGIFLFLVAEASAQFTPFPITPFLTSPCSSIPVGGSQSIRDIDLRTDDPSTFWARLKAAIALYHSGFNNYLSPAEIQRRAEEAYKSALDECLGAMSDFSSTGTKSATAARNAFAYPPGFTRAAGAFARGDWNRDGRDDAALVFGDSVFVQLDRGNGNLDNGRLLRYTADANFRAAATGDFTGDTIPDLVVCCTGTGASRSIVLIRGDGAGSFGTAATPLMRGANSIYAVDWNDDRKLDLVGLTPVGEPFLAIGNGDGTFHTPRTSAALVHASLVLAADVTGDARPDLIVFTESQAVTIPNTGDAFGSPVATNLPFRDISGMQSAIAGDLNGDGRTDVAGLNDDDELLTVMFGDGAGRFPSASAQRGGTASGFSAAVLDATGRSLLMVPDPSSNSIMYFPVTSTGVNGPQLLRLPDDFRGRPASGVGDLNGDGRADAVVTEGSGGSLRLQVFPGTPALVGINRQTLPALVRTATSGRSPEPLAVFLADFKGGGDPDALVVDGSGDPRVFLHVGDGRGGLANASETALPLIVHAATTADFNRDGRTDLALGAYTFGTPGEVQILLSGPAGLLAPVRIPIGDFQPSAIAAGDVNGDGRPDIVFGAQNPVSFAWIARVLLATGDTTFAAPIALSVSATSLITAAAIANVDADAQPEILPASGGLRIFKGSAFTAVDNAGTIFSLANSILVSDFNGDRTPDLLLATCCGETSNYLHLGRGNGTFFPALPGPPMDSRKMFLADFNGDGHLEFAQTFDGGMVIHPGFNPHFGIAVHGASFYTTPLAPASIASVFGEKLATAAASATANDQFDVGGTSVFLVDSAGALFACPLFFVSPSQVNFYVPAAVAPGAATLTVLGPTGGAVSSLQIVPVSPGIFRAAGVTPALVGAVTRVRDGVQTLESIVDAPIDLGPAGDVVVLTIYATGLRGRTSLANVRININTLSNAAPIASVVPEYAGAQGGFLGLDQLNVILPRSLAGLGTLAVTVVADGIASNPTTINVR